MIDTLRAIERMQEWRSGMRYFVTVDGPELGDSYELTGEHGVEVHEKSSAGTSKTSLTVKAKCFWNFGHI
jgi:hypothetical protein